MTNDPEHNQTDPRPLDELRQCIDGVDQQIVELLARRAELVVEVGESKRDTQTPIYAPHRERAVLDRIQALNKGPLSNHTLECIYRELMSGSFSLEQALRIGYLGPPGSFSHLAAVRHFGRSVDFAEFGAIESVFRAVASGHCQYGLVPYENSTGGSVTDTLDAFQEYEVKVYAEAQIEINHCLLSNVPKDRIQRIASRPQALGQCRQWLAREFPDAEHVVTASSSLAVQSVVDSQDAAAIGSSLAGSLYGVNILFEGVQDKPNNVTRFLVIAMEDALPTGNDKTTISFVTNHEPGALVDVLAVFRDAGINLSHIDKRPSGRENWQYMFFIDADAHQDDPTMQDVISRACELCRVFNVHGAYPRAEQVL